MWRPCDFHLFSDVFCAGHGQVLSLWKSGTHSCHWMLFNSITAIKTIAANLPQEQPIATSLAKSVSELFSVFFSAIMDSTPPTSKRVKTRAVRSGGRLEGWFSRDNDLIERYRFEISTKVINNPNVVCFDWLKNQKLDNVRRLLKNQSLRKFLEMKGNIYPDLKRVFYTNLKFEGNNLVSHVKGVDMEITHEVWAAVAGLKYSGLRINKGNLGVVEDFYKIQYYKSCLKSQHAQVRTCSVGGLKLDERLLALIVTWILTPRGSNHFVLTEEDLVYIFCIMKKIRINWIHIMSWSSQLKSWTMDLSAKWVSPK